MSQITTIWSKIAKVIRRASSSITQRASEMIAVNRTRNIVASPTSEAKDCGIVIDLTHTMAICTNINTIFDIFERNSVEELDECRQLGFEYTGKWSEQIPKIASIITADQSNYIN